MILSNGATPLIYLWLNHEGVVLAKWREQYVVWRFLEKNGVADCIDGDYFDDLQEAKNCFYRRI